MPKEIKKHSDVLRAIESVDIISELAERHDGHFEHELDLEVIAYGRNYNGKKVGPYMRLLEFDAGEEIIREGDWGGNDFYISVDGTLDVHVRDKEGGQNKRVGEIAPGMSFGEMAILAGVPRNATVTVPEGSKATVLEITRPALRLLRKLPKFGRMLDANYRKHGLARTLVDVRQVAGDAFSPELIEKLGKAARFMVYARHHVLFREGAPLDRIVFIRNGWVRRVRGLDAANVGDMLVAGLTDDVNVDFLGTGNCLGLEGVARDLRWAYTATVLQRTEVLEVSIPRLRADPALRETLERTFAQFSLADDDVLIANETSKALVVATEREISTGVVDGTNLLVMDMDLCVRCGNCSLACHRVHGQSRLLRRGIHIERPRKIGGTSSQHVLSPSVCMHCQDPECLTGCPTGAIARFANGQIDIEPKTCIGCGDCATQCPYNAITMIPRKPETALPAPTWSGRLRGWLTLAPPAPPPAVTATDNLLATKCNLCAGTPLNPKGASTEAYSCQENCPTGALVRVNPREYFTEVNTRIGLVYRDQTHAIGRNIHKRDTIARLWHAFGILATIAVTFAFLWGLARHEIDEPLGGTWLSLRWVTGLVGLLGVAIVMTYPARKQIYRRRAWPLRYWMLAHVYFGVIAGITLLLHGGRSTGGLLTTALMISFDAVIFTGLFGILCYLVCPRIMTSIEGEPLLVEDLIARRAELRETLAGIAGRSNDAVRQLVKVKVRRKFFSFIYLLRQYFKREELSALLAGAREEFEAESRNLDAPSRRLLTEAIEATVTLRRVDSLVYLHQLLKLWLAPHVVATSLMLMLMLVHILQVVFFAVR